MDDPDTYAISAVRRRRQRKQAPQISGPEDLYRLLYPHLRDADRELFYGTYLSTKHHVLAVELIAVGSLSASLVHPREVFKPAIQYSASALVVGHNHPSGDAEPSPEDVAFTQRLAKCGDLLGIRLLDHLVIGNGHYTSLKERGYL